MMALVMYYHPQETNNIICGYGTHESMTRGYSLVVCIVKRYASHVVTMRLFLCL